MVNAGFDFGLSCVELTTYVPYDPLQSPPVSAFDKRNEHSLMETWGNSLVNQYTYLKDIDVTFIVYPFCVSIVHTYPTNDP